MDPEVMHELERLEDLRKQLEKRVEQLGERVDRLEAKRIKVSYPQPEHLALNNTISVTIRGEREVACVMEALYKAGFVAKLMQCAR